MCIGQLVLLSIVALAVLIVALVESAEEDVAFYFVGIPMKRAF